MALAISISPEDVVLSKNLVHVRLLSTSYSGLDNYKTVLRILFEDEYGEGTFSQIAEIEAQPDSNGFTHFNIQKILEKKLLLTTPFRVPDVEDQHPYTCDTLRRYKLEYFERYGDPQEDQAAVVSASYQVLLGGVDWHYHGFYDFFDNLSADNALLTYIPSGITATRSQPNFLTFINWTGPYTRFFLKIRQWDEDGEELTGFSTYHTIDGDDDDPPYLLTNQAAVFPATADVLGVHAEAVKYSVQVWSLVSEGLDPQIAVSQEYYIYLDDEYQHQPADIIWFGSFRNPHVLRCKGRKRTALSIERRVSERIISWGDDPHVGSLTQHDRNFNQQFTYRTGPLRTDDVDALQEMLIENTLLEYAADHNYYRLLLTQNRYDIHETRVTPHHLEFSAERSIAPGSYMKVRSAAMPAADDNLWELNDNGFWELNTGSGYWQLNG